MAVGGAALAVGAGEGGPAGVEGGVVELDVNPGDLAVKLGVVPGEVDGLPAGVHGERGLEGVVRDDVAVRIVAAIDDGGALGPGGDGGLAAEGAGLDERQLHLGGIRVGPDDGRLGVLVQAHDNLLARLRPNGAGERAGVGRREVQGGEGRIAVGELDDAGKTAGQNGIGDGLQGESGIGGAEEEVALALDGVDGERGGKGLFPETDLIVRCDGDGADGDRAARGDGAIAGEGIDGEILQGDLAIDNKARMRSSDLQVDALLGGGRSLEGEGDGVLRITNDGRTIVNRQAALAEGIEGRVAGEGERGPIRDRKIHASFAGGDAAKGDITLKGEDAGAVLKEALILGREEVRGHVRGHGVVRQGQRGGGVGEGDGGKAVLGGVLCGKAQGAVGGDGDGPAAGDSGEGRGQGEVAIHREGGGSPAGRTLGDGEADGAAGRAARVLEAKRAGQ